MPKDTRRRSCGRLSHLDPWRKSAAFRMIARETLVRFNTKRQAEPRCGAKRRTDGEPCRGFPLENGRCRHHGGKTPKGAGWGRPVFSADPVKKLSKLASLERREAKRLARIAAMSPEERERYERRRARVVLGSPAERHRKRIDRDAAESIAALFEADRNPPAVPAEPRKHPGRPPGRRKTTKAAIALTSHPRGGIFD